MNSIRDDHEVIGNGKVIFPYKCIMVFLYTIDVWTATSLPTQESTKRVIFLMLCMGSRGRYPNDWTSKWGRFWIMC
jgi:hypothetical protein